MQTISTRRLVCRKPRKYDGVDLAVGEVFVATEADARYFEKHGIATPFEGTADEIQNSEAVAADVQPEPEIEQVVEARITPRRRQYRRRSTVASENSTPGDNQPPEDLNGVAYSDVSDSD